MENLHKICSLSRRTCKFFVTKSRLQAIVRKIFVGNTHKIYGCQSKSQMFKMSTSVWVSLYSCWLQRCCVYLYNYKHFSAYGSLMSAFSRVHFLLRWLLRSLTFWKTEIFTDFGNLCTWLTQILYEGVQFFPKIMRKS